MRPRTGDYSDRRYHLLQDSPRPRTRSSLISGLRNTLFRHPYLVAVICVATILIVWEMHRMWILQTVAALLSIGSTTATFSMPTPWTWRCVRQVTGNSRCVKELLTATSSGTMTLEACQLTCGKGGSLWPMPQSVQLGNTLSEFVPESITKTFFANPEDTALLESAFQIFLKNLNQYHPDYLESDVLWKSSPTPAHRLKIEVKITGPTTSYLTLNTEDEGYSLRVGSVDTVTSARITAKTYFGARHGLETLSQLIAYEESSNALKIVSFADIADKPAFTYRGLLLDTSRNFYPVKDIERTLDAMAANKLNTFHWHITDSHSFPLVINSLPNMAYYGAYSSRQVYRPEDVSHLVQYGRVRGVRVLPELDAPAHVGNGWDWGPQHGLGRLAVCVNQEPWQKYCVEPPCGQLNIANENIYLMLGKIYEDMVNMFGPIDLFHFGGDEVNLHCWNTTEEITTWMTQQGLPLTDDSYYNKWSEFQSKSYDLLTKANKGKQVPGILWTSHLTEKNKTDLYLDNSKYIIQIWTTGTDPLIKELLEKKYRVILTNYDAWYLDCGFGAWVKKGQSWCTPYKDWRVVYDNSPSKIALNLTGDPLSLDLVMGGEVALWSEQADKESLDTRVWPRAAGLAERLWTDPKTNWESAEYRMSHQRQRLVQRGVQADRLQPQWCHQNEGLCYFDPSI